MDFAPPFDRWLKQRRKELDLTQVNLAERMGYSVFAVRKIESGYARPSRQMAEKLASALDIPQESASEFMAFARGIEFRHPMKELPSPPTPLLGRANDVAAVRHTLERADVRLLTLIGPPGVGKTRLAIEVARAVSPAFADGVCFVALAGAGDADLVAPAIANSLGIRSGMEHPAVEAVKSTLRGKHLLLVLDNFEHLLAGASLVTELLQAAPHLKVLVTSRAALRVSGEYMFAVPPLEVPDLQRLPAPEGLMRYAAVELFAQHAQMVRPHFILDKDNAPAVAEVCCRLDGLPLAIEMAAARTRSFTPQTLVLHLDHHLGAAMRLLIAGPRDLPPRQQSLRATLDWSYHLLSAQEQSLLRRLAVFAGGCTLEAAQMVCSDERSEISDSRYEIPANESLISNLQSLIDNSLVQQVEGSGGQSRYTMLETVREYALEHLEASGEAEAVRRQHARYYAMKCVVDMDSPAWPVVCTDLLKEFARERDNLYAALSWSKGCADEPLLHLLISGVISWLVYVGGWYWGFRGDAKAIASELAWSLARNPGAPLARRAIALQGLGILWQGLGDFDQSARAEDESLALSLAAGALGIAASAAHIRGYCAYASGDLAQAERFFAQVMQIGERTGSPGWVLNGTQMLGHLALERGDLGRAAELLGRALELACALGIKTDIGGGQAIVLQDLGLLAYEQGDYTRSYELGYQALRLFEAEGEITRHSAQHLYLGRAALAQQHSSTAEQHFVEGLRIAREYGLRTERTLSLLAQAAAQRGNMARYARLMGAVASAGFSGWRLQGAISTHEYNQCQAAIAEARSHLSDPAFAAAWAEGQAMTLEQAVEYALDGGGD